MKSKALKEPDYCKICNRDFKPDPKYGGSPCQCNGIQPYAKSNYPGETCLVPSHPENTGEQHWYKREDVDARLKELNGQIVQLEAILRGGQ